jgi:hypothetical protein
MIRYVVVMAKHTVTAVKQLAEALQNIQKVLVRSKTIAGINIAVVCSRAPWREK